MRIEEVSGDGKEKKLPDTISGRNERNKSQKDAQTGQKVQLCNQEIHACNAIKHAICLDGIINCSLMET